MIPLCEPNLSGNEALYLQQCIETRYVSSVGAFVSRFEETCASATGHVGAFSTSSGTTGLHLALTTCGVQQGDLIVLPSLTFIASANAISHCGATPWLLDVNKESWTLDPEQLAEVLEHKTERREQGLFHYPSGRRIGAIMPVYTLGIPADMDAIVPLAHRYGLPVICDAAAALGALYRGRPLGDLGADFSVLSFNGNKTVTTGSGGAILSNDASLLAEARHLGTTARISTDYTHDKIGFNYRMSNLEAAVGCAQMERLDEFISAKRAIDQRYRTELAEIPGLGFFPAPEWAKSACWFSGFLLPEEVQNTMICQKFRHAGIEARPFWKPVHLQAPYISAPCETTSITDNIWRRVITLPCSTGLTPDEQTVVINAAKEIFRDF